MSHSFSEGATKYDRGYDRKTRYKEKQEQSQVLSFRGFLGKLYLCFSPAVLERRRPLSHKCLFVFMVKPPSPSSLDLAAVVKKFFACCFCGKEGEEEEKGKKGKTDRELCGFDNV